MNKWMKKKTKTKTKKTKKLGSNKKKCAQLIHMYADIDALTNSPWLYLCACMQTWLQMCLLNGEDWYGLTVKFLITKVSTEREVF